MTTAALLAFGATVLAARSVTGRRARRRLAALAPGPKVPARWPSALRARVEDAALPVDTDTFLSGWAAGALGLVGLATLSRGLGGLVLSAVLAGTPALLVAVRRDERRRRRRRALPATVDSLAAAVRGGSSLRRAVTAAARTAPPEVSTELTEVVERVRRGESTAATLSPWITDPDPDVHLVGRTLALLAELGGHRAVALDRLAAVLRARADLRRQRDAMASQARLSALVMSAAPAGFTTLSVLTDARVADFLFTTAPGLGCLATGLGLTAAGAAWMLRLTRGATT